MVRWLRVRYLGPIVSSDRLVMILSDPWTSAVDWDNMRFSPVVLGPYLNKHLKVANKVWSHQNPYNHHWMSASLWSFKCVLTSLETSRFLQSPQTLRTTLKHIEMSFYFAIVGTKDNPIYEAEFGTSKQGGDGVARVLLPHCHHIILDLVVNTFLSSAKSNALWTSLSSTQALT